MSRWKSKYTECRYIDVDERSRCIRARNQNKDRAEPHDTRLERRLSEKEVVWNSGTRDRIGKHRMLLKIE